MNATQKGQYINRVEDTSHIINEIDSLLHNLLNKNRLKEEWQRIEKGDSKNIHPFVMAAYKAHKQIQSFIEKKVFAVTPEILELYELAVKANRLKKANVKGLDSRLNTLISQDLNKYYESKYQLQVGEMLLNKGYKINFIEEEIKQTPDILVTQFNESCEIECKHKNPNEISKDYVKSIYNSTQIARKQFSKSYAGLITIDTSEEQLKKCSLEDLKKVIDIAMKNSKSISGVLLTFKSIEEDQDDFIYRHRVGGFFNNPNARYKIPEWLFKNLINV